MDDVLERAERLINKFRNQWGYHPLDGEKMVCDLTAEVRALRADVVWVLANRAQLWVDEGPLGNGQRSITWCDLAGFPGENPHDGTEASILRAVREARQK